MPHLVVQYSGELEPAIDAKRLCDALAEVLRSQRDASGEPVYPVGGTRVLAYPSAASSVGDSRPDRAFVYLHLRIAAGRAPDVVRRTGEALQAATTAHLAALLAERAVGCTLQIDEGAPVYDAKFGSLRRALGT